MSRTEIAETSISRTDLVQPSLIGEDRDMSVETGAAYSLSCQRRPAVHCERPGYDYLTSLQWALTTVVRVYRFSLK